MDEPILLSESLPFPLLDEEVEEEDLPDLVSEVLAVVLAPDLALVPEVLESEAEADVLLPLLEEPVDPEEDEGLELMPLWPEDPILELPWPEAPIPEPLWLDEPMPEPL
jgi:hypothetical protein